MLNMTLKCLNTHFNKRFPQLAQSTCCVSINRALQSQNLNFISGDGHPSWI